MYSDVGLVLGLVVFLAVGDEAAAEDTSVSSYVTSSLLLGMRRDSVSMVG